MAERPILFSSPMIRALLDGRKTQTRRVVRCAGLDLHRDRISRWECVDGWWEPRAHSTHVERQFVTTFPLGLRALYAVGDVLWVRETWADLRGKGFDEHQFGYRADSLNRRGEEDGDSQRCRLDFGVQWKPSIFMPRAACRLTLRVTDVRVQRLQEISEEDARAEGCGYSGPAPDKPMSERDLFAALWDSINAKRAPWASNPWVFAITFEKIKETDHA